MNRKILHKKKPQKSEEEKDELKNKQSYSNSRQLILMNLLKYFTFEMHESIPFTKTEFSFFSTHARK